MYGLIREIEIFYCGTGLYGRYWVGLVMNWAVSSFMVCSEKFKCALVALDGMGEIGLWCPF